MTQFSQENYHASTSPSNKFKNSTHRYNPIIGSRVEMCTRIENMRNLFHVIEYFNLRHTFTWLYHNLIDKKSQKSESQNWSKRTALHDWFKIKLWYSHVMLWRQKQNTLRTFLLWHAKKTKNTIRETGLYGFWNLGTINTCFPDRVFGYVIF